MNITSTAMSTIATRTTVLTITTPLLERFDAARDEFSKADISEDLQLVIGGPSSGTDQAVKLVRAMDAMATIAQAAITITVDLFLAVDQITESLDRWEQDKQEFDIVVPA